MTEKYIALALSVACFASFAWAIRNLFGAPKGTPLQMKVLSALGLLFSASQLAAIWIAHPAWSPMMLPGLVFFVISLALFWWAAPYARRAALSVAFAESRAAVLMTEGPYKFIRHPFYASYLSYWIAGVLVSQQPWLGLSVLIMGSFYAWAIWCEERAFLSGPLAREYAAYRGRAGALLPKFSLAFEAARRR